LPTLNIVPMINEYSLILTSEHFLYFPIIGMLLFVMGIVHTWLEHKSSRKKNFASTIIFGCIVVIFMRLTIMYNTFWRAEIPLFERTLQFEKDFGRVHFLLAKAYTSAGRIQDAIEEDRKALAIMHGYLQKVKSAEIRVWYEGYIKQINYHMGYCFGVLGDVAGSLDHYKKALALEPDSDIYRHAVALTYLKTGNFHDAIKHFEKIVESNADNLMAMNSLALCYQEIGDNAKAEKLLRTIVDRDRQSVSAKQNLDKFLQIKNEL